MGQPKRGVRKRAECKECRELKAIHARGLCNGCYARPGVAERYTPVTNQYGKPPNPSGPRCVHCKLRGGYRARGLCFGCSMMPQVRALYPLSESKYSAWRNDAREPDSHGSLPLAAEPTTTLVGSAERIVVYAARRARGEAIFHPQDSQQWMEFCSMASGGDSRQDYAFAARRSRR